MGRSSRSGRIGDTAEKLNDLAYLAGISPDHSFVDIPLFTKGGASVDIGLLQHYHAVIVAVAPESTLAMASKHDNGSAKEAVEFVDDTGGTLVWFPQTVKQIPEVYALLHAVLNCPGGQVMRPGSVFAKLGSQSRYHRPEERNLVIQKAKDLQQAYSQTILNGPWAVAPPLKGDSPTKKTGPFRFTCFVRAPLTSALYQIDSNGPVRVDTLDHQQEQEQERRGSQPSVLTASVVGRIRSMVNIGPNNLEHAIVGLVSLHS